MIIERLSSASIIQSRKLFGLVDPEDEVVTIFRKKETDKLTQQFVVIRLTLITCLMNAIRLCFDI